jgi:hypothetical protein
MQCDFDSLIGIPQSLAENCDAPNQGANVLRATSRDRNDRALGRRWTDPDEPLNVGTLTTE